jgi:hypothetical protein
MDRGARAPQAVGRSDPRGDLVPISLRRLAIAAIILAACAAIAFL